MESIWPRIWWDAGRSRGVVRSQHVTVEISGPPTLAEGIEAIDYAPSLDTAELRQRGFGVRSMSAAELAAARSLIERLEDAVRPLLWIDGRRQ